MNYLLGIDIGTTGTKAVLVDEDGGIIKTAYQGYPLIKNNPPHVQQDAMAWYEAVVKTVNECVSDVPDVKRIKAMSFSTQGGCLVLTDRSGRPLTHAISWMDNTSEKARRTLLQTYDEDFFFKTTGWRISPSLNLCRIKQMSNDQPDLLANTSKFLTTIDFLHLIMTGQAVIDPSNATITQLMNVKSLEWDDQLLSMISMDKERLAQIRPSGTIVGTLTNEASKALGLHPNVRVVSGGHDQYCAAVGAGALKPGDVFLSTGTAWVVLGLTNTLKTDPDQYIAIGPHINPKYYGALVSVYSAGLSLEWIRNAFQIREEQNGQWVDASFKSIDQKAAEIRERAKNVMFFPYFNGSGFPHWQANTKASITGLGLENDVYDVALSAMESACFHVKDTLARYRKAGYSPDRLRVTGGASRSDVWMGLLSNVIDEEVIRLEQSNAASIGAAIIAGTGVGLFKNLEQGYQRFAGGEFHIEKQPHIVSWYQTKYDAFLKARKTMSRMG